MPQRLDIVLLGDASHTDINGHIFGRGFQPVQRIAQLFPGSAADKDLVGAQVTSFRLAARLVRTLTMGRSAVALGTAGAAGIGESSPAPGAMADSFCHCDGTIPP